MQTTLVIVQARMMSTRLPGKILKPFYDGRSILDIQLERLKKALPNHTIVVATTTNKADQEIVDACAALGVDSFRGSENDVLKRFIDCAETYKTERVVRVCSDNPFLDIANLRKLVDVDADTTMDYLSYRDANGTPAIKTHWGLFAEVVSVNALKNAAKQTDEAFYHEHVTNYIYGNPKQFNVVLLDAPVAVINRKDLRFTIDTKTDFEAIQELYQQAKNANLEALINAVDAMPNVKQRMKEGIDTFSK
jgi:spore coat polysaccharide biosynthesis protein SpsF (cytidylyltransferase family)